MSETIRGPRAMTRVRVVEVAGSGLEVPADQLAEAGAGPGTIWDRRVPFRHNECPMFAGTRQAVIDPPPYCVVIPARDRCSVLVNTSAPVAPGSISREGKAWEVAACLGLELVQTDSPVVCTPRSENHQQRFKMRLPSGADRGVLVLRAGRQSIAVGNRSFIKGDLSVVVAATRGSVLSSPMPPVVVYDHDGTADQAYVPLVPGQDLLVLATGPHPEGVPEGVLSKTAEGRLGEVGAALYRCVANPPLNEPFFVEGRGGSSCVIVPSVMEFGDHHSYFVVTEPMPSVLLYCGNISGFRVDLVGKSKVSNRSPDHIKQVFAAEGRSYGFFVERGVGWVRLCRAASTLTVRAEAR
jgi:hypothetical protein